ncbi:unnamed protein product [Vicia faba]|uniref:Peptidase S26 domain-containing protein n=1 Tax=Vicia faba TaxID=3906 RepID=A0AAV0Z917_VICFA|nr:unnamed protein product [Vicia faba]
MTFMNNIRSATKEALDRTAIIAKFLCCLHFTANYLCSPTHAYGPSMLPTLNIAGDVLLVEHLSPRIGKVGHGDLVLVRSPLNPNRNLTKRVVAMEGDTVTFFDASGSDSSRTAVVPKGHEKCFCGFGHPVALDCLIIEDILMKCSFNCI